MVNPHSNIMNNLQARLSAVSKVCESLKWDTIGYNGANGDLYSISLMGEIRLQCVYSNVITRLAIETYPDAVCKITSNGFTEMKFHVDGFEFNIVLS